MPTYSMLPEDRVRLLHMIEAASDAMSFVADDTQPPNWSRIGKPCLP